MTAAPFTLCAWWCASAVFGAAPPPSGRGVAHAGGGLAAVLPTVEAGLTVGVAGEAAMGLRWETHAGVNHSVAAGARVRVARGWALGAEVAYADFVSRRSFGVDLSRSPFGTGLTVEPGWAWTRRDGRLGVGGGLTVRLDEPGVQSARVAVTLDLGPLFLRAQALVPLAPDTRVLGFFPALVVGKTFGLERADWRPEDATLERGAAERPSALAAGTRAKESTSGAAILVLGGFTVLDVLPALPPAPILTGELQLAWRLGDRVTLGGRYATNLGLQHRLGPELRVDVVALGPVSLGLRVHPSAALAGTPEDVAGDVATVAALTVDWRRGPLRLALEGGVTVEWLVYEHIGGATRVDDAPYWASSDLAAAAAWTLASGVTLVARVELAVPRAPDDPFAVLGVYPRLLAGAAWRL